MIHLENALLKATISPLGAELKSLYSKTQNRECMWHADPRIWGRTAPVLFPIVGQLRDNSYNHNKGSYQMSQHGFARDFEFSIVSSNSTCAVLELHQNEESLKKFPFQFNLQITYNLIEQSIEVTYHIKNPSTTDNLYYSIGAHPGFACPFDKISQFEDYELVFEAFETVDKIEFSNGLLTGNRFKNYLNNEKAIPVNRALFKADALIFNNMKSQWVAIKHKNSERAIKLHFKGFPYLGIWTQPKNPGDFICLEPWYGITDSQNSSNEFSEKEGRLNLAPNKAFNASYTIEVI